MRESIEESVKAFISPKFIKAQHFKRHGKRLYKERNSIYYYYFPILCNFTNEDFAQGIYNNQY